MPKIKFLKNTKKISKKFKNLIDFRFMYYYIYMLKDKFGYFNFRHRLGRKINFQKNYNLLKQVIIFNNKKGKNYIRNDFLKKYYLDNVSLSKDVLNYKIYYSNYNEFYNFWISFIKRCQDLKKINNIIYKNYLFLILKNKFKGNLFYLQMDRELSSKFILDEYFFNFKFFVRKKNLGIEKKVNTFFNLYKRSYFLKIFLFKKLKKYSKWFRFISKVSLLEDELTRSKSLIKYKKLVNSIQFFKVVNSLKFFKKFYFLLVRFNSFIKKFLLNLGFDKSYFLKNREDKNYFIYLKNRIGLKQIIFSDLVYRFKYNFIKRHFFFGQDCGYAVL